MLPQMLCMIQHVLNISIMQPRPMISLESEPSLIGIGTPKSPQITWYTNNYIWECEFSGILISGFLSIHLSEKLQDFRIYSCFSCIDDVICIKGYFVVFQRCLSQCVNSSVVLRLMGRGGGGAGPPSLRGGARGTGRGRGKSSGINN